MARATDVAPTQTPVPADRAGRIEDYIAYLEAEWADVPELAQEWLTWDEHSRFSFATDWPIREDRLASLLQEERRGVLSATQQERLTRLKSLITQHRPTLDRLLATVQG
jgi:hypothetical protein